MGIYIHIPFCIQKCEYCDFLSFVSSSRTRERYVEALLSEIRILGKQYEDVSVSSVFVGGGTPSCLEAFQLEEIFWTLRSSFHIMVDVEFSVECNPGTLDESKAKAMRAAGVNRISLGLQSADDTELMALGRIHTYGMFLESYELLRENGFSNINVDLMSGLPNQKTKDWEETLRKVAGLGPQHISAYGLIVEEGTGLFRKILSERKKGLESLPDEECEREMYYMTKGILRDFGYHQYEISNFSRSGFACRHNIDCWTRKDYLGIGLGASSLIQETRYKNTADMKRYLENSNRPDSIQTEKTVLSIEDRMSEYMFLGLRMTDGISISGFNRSFGLDFFEVYGEITLRMEMEGLIFRSEDVIALTPRGVDLSNFVMAGYLL
ncbi:oxygen-independent coproporphyrinogen-3 oxidase [Parasporobacterium paucivorans DSM 15970]|uniref:Heme chaperone HemW n=2 Tax=Parasporobacterium TaxID=115543 RepID=A0A1M6C2S9_9FIRM|nr:oxygen-independent coproporphyrinogen-3 oxidase [Parasporobacterium paucivorans DSM 15970]